MHSTETALLKVADDILHALDDGFAVAHTLLDLSSAFDTIDHGILLKRLQHHFGIKDAALAWIRSYLADRHQSVIISNRISDPKLLQYGVPQGSVLGPLLFLCYVAPLADIINKQELCYHSYADDTQIYAAFTSKDLNQMSQAVGTLETCINNIDQWTQINKLKLNRDKTELIVYTTRSKSSVINDFGPLCIGADTIYSCNTISNLGVIFDSTMSLEQHISKIVRTINFHLHNIGRVRKYLTIDATKALVQAFVISRLDYCNSLLSGLPDTQIVRLQKLQNTAARIITCTKPWQHITPVLKDLHWLPVHSRIKYKIILLTFKIINNIAPSYLCNLIKLHVPGRNLRSQHKLLLSVPRTELVTYGDRSFSKVSPILWNSLPDSLRSITSEACFKRSLKTFLFNEAYNT